MLEAARRRGLPEDTAVEFLRASAEDLPFEAEFVTRTASMIASLFSGLVAIYF